MRRGLVVGKFAPLHLGHELVIRRALAECDEVVVLGYANPEREGCPAELRQRWLARAFPDATCLVVTDALLRERLGDGAPALPRDDAPELEHRRFVGFVCRTILGVTVHAVFTSEAYGAGFASDMTAYFRGSEPGHPDVEHVSVNPARAQVPISASRLRADIHGLRRFLPPFVYGSFVERVALLGGESSGKSTLAARLAEHFATEHVAEYGRELWVQRGGALSYEDLARIATEQVAREEQATERSLRFLFCDTSPLTTLFYSRSLFGRAAPELEALAARPYALHVLCAPDFPFVQDGTRRTDAFRKEQHAWYVEELSRRGARYLVAEGSVDDRVATIAAALAVAR